jgi:hypothetical protein
MSGCSESRNCPICENQMDIYSDYKPFDNVSGCCLNCGFTISTIVQQMDIKELNVMRKDNELPALKASDIKKYKKEIENIW